MSKNPSLSPLISFSPLFIASVSVTNLLFESGDEEFSDNSLITRGIFDTTLNDIGRFVAEFFPFQRLECHFGTINLWCPTEIGAIFKGQFKTVPCDGFAKLNDNTIFV